MRLIAFNSPFRNFKNYKNVHSLFCFEIVYLELFTLIMQNLYGKKKTLALIESRNSCFILPFFPGYLCLLPSPPTPQLWKLTGVKLSVSIFVAIYNTCIILETQLQGIIEQIFKFSCQHVPNWEEFAFC